MSNSEQSQKQVLKWVLGLIFALFVIAGFTILYQHFFGTQYPGRIQNAARADLELLLKAEKSFFDRYGFYTTDLVSLALQPKFVFYKIGFVRPAEPTEASAKVEGLDAARKDLDALKAAKPEMALKYSDETALGTIDFAGLVSYCADCTATATTFKAVAAANLDEDPVLDIWTVDHTGKYDHLVDDLK